MFSDIIQGVPKKITHFYSHLTFKRNSSKMVCHNHLKFDVQRVPIGNSLHINKGQIMDILGHVCTVQVISVLVGNPNVKFGYPQNTGRYPNTHRAK